MAHDPTRTARMCKLYKAGVPVKEIAAEFGVQNPAVWKALRRGGVLPPYQPKTERGAGRPVGGGTAGYTAKRLEKSAAAIAEREARESQKASSVVRVFDREPCPMCGTRKDFGCKHFPHGSVLSALPVTLPERAGLEAGRSGVFCDSRGVRHD